MRALKPTWMLAGLLAVAAIAMWAGAYGLQHSDPYLAAERFLQTRGLDVVRSTDLRPLAERPAARTSLMLLGNRDRMSAAQAQKLLAWVYAGGWLLVSAQGYWTPNGGGSDPLLDPLNIRLLNAYASAGPAPLAARSTLTELYLETDRQPMLLGFAPGRHLEDADDLAQSWANSPQGTHMLQLNLGAGTLTVVSDTALWRTPAIGQFDNAWLLWYLNQGREVVLQYRDPQLTGWRALAAYPASLTCAVTLLSLTGWWAAGRRAARRRPAAPEAGGRHRHLDREHLLRALQDEIQRHAALRHPGFRHWPVTAQWQLLAKLTGTSTAAIGQALRPHPGERLTATAFRQHVTQLQAIRNAL